MNSSITNSDATRSAASRFLIAFGLVVLALVGTTFWLVQPIAPQFTGNLSFDQKLFFLRQHPPQADKPLTLVVGSSMALNNLDTDLITGANNGATLNLGVWGMSLHDTGKLAAQFEGLYPVDEIILSTQFFEMRDDPRTNFVISDAALQAYLSEPGPLAGIAYRDFYQALRTRQNWPRKYANPESYMNLSFTRTGAIPLPIPHEAIDPSRWNPPEKFQSACVNCMKEIDTLCRKTRAQGLPFTAVMPPLTHWIRENRPEIKAIYDDRKDRLRAVLKQCNGGFFDAAAWGDFDDSCFADFAHLNAEGMKRMTSVFVDWRAGHAKRQDRPIVCGDAPEKPE